MSREIRQTELREKTQQLLHGSLKQVRVAALAAVLVPLASVAVSAAVGDTSGVCNSAGCVCSASSGQVGAPYSSILAFTGGVHPDTLSISSGSLPLGLAVNLNTGLISGTPTTKGTYTVVWGVQDSSIPSLAGSITCSITIATGPPPPTAAVPSPCDFVTSGGFVLTDAGKEANFGAHGGCKHDGFWGHINYVDHDTGYHVDSIEITGYLTPSTGSNIRDICGTATTNRAETQPVLFRVRVIDNGEPGIADQFGIALSNGYLVSTRLLNGGMGGGGNVQLHDPNPSTTGPISPPDEATMCMGVAAP